MSSKITSIIGDDSLTEEEAIEQIEKELEDMNLTELERLRRDNPTLAEAWEQIKVIRALTDTKSVNSNRPAWERAYYELVEGVESDNEQLRDAWDKYYMLKNLIVGAKE